MSEIPKPHIRAELKNFGGKECWVFYVKTGYFMPMVDWCSKYEHYHPIPGYATHWEAWQLGTKILIQRKP